MQTNQLENLIKCTKTLKLLYIEDNIDVQQQTTKMLKSFFVHITVVDNGKIALDAFKKHNTFDLVITDIEMPLLDGISLIESIRKICKKIPIVVLSAHDNKDYYSTTVNYGIDGYILKPYTLDQIIQTLSFIVEKYEFKSNSQNIKKLDFDFSWNSELKQLSRNNQTFKLSKNETKLFELFINANGQQISYDKITYHLFDTPEDNIKKIRNIITRLKMKLGYDLFETIYSHGYSLKYRKN